MDLKNVSYKLVGVIFLIISLCLITQTIKAKEWNGIVPLKSSRADVEKLLGKPDENGGYKIKGQYGFIRYSLTDCAASEKCICPAGKDIVVEIRVHIHYKLKLKKLKLDLKNYKKKADPELLVYETYSNYDEGIEYVVFTEENTIDSITYLPAKRDCEEALKRKSEIKQE